MIHLPSVPELTIILFIVFLLFGHKIFTRFFTNIKQTIIEARKTVDELQEGLKDDE